MPTKNSISSREIEEIEAAAVSGDPVLPGLPGGGLLERPELSDELIDELLAGATTAQEIVGPDGLLKQLTSRAGCWNARWRPRSPSTSAIRPATRRPAAPATRATGARPRPC